MPPARRTTYSSEMASLCAQSGPLPHEALAVIMPVCIGLCLLAVLADAATYCCCPPPDYRPRSQEEERPLSPTTLLEQEVEAVKRRGRQVEADMVR